MLNSLFLCTKVSSTNKTEHYTINFIEIRLPKKFSALSLCISSLEIRAENFYYTLTELLLKLVFDSKNAGVLANLNYISNTWMDA